MGRVKLQLRKIENRTNRHITFAKRKSGLVKKAHELSTLCDVEIAVIIFSPAGKLILFDAKKRPEEIIESYLNLPEKQRGRLHNEEQFKFMNLLENDKNYRCKYMQLVQRISNQMSLEARIHSHLSMFGKMSSESDLEEIENEILLCNFESENIERQIRGFVGSPNFFKTMSEVEFHEEILEKALKCVRNRKRAFLQEIENDTGGVMGSSSHSLNGPQQIVPTSLVMDAADRCNGVETFNQPQTLAGIMQSPGMLQGYAFPSNNIQNNGDSSSNVFMPNSDHLNANFSQGKNITEQGSGSTNAVQSSAGDPAMSCFAAFSRHDHCARGPFPF